MGHFVNCFSGFNKQYSDIFCRKNVSSFCIAKATHIFSAKNFSIFAYHSMFVCVEVLQPSKPNGVMSNTVSLPNHTFTGQV